MKWLALSSTMDERARRLWAGAEAMGWGGVTAVGRATGLARSTIQKGRNELRDGAQPDDLVRVRRRGTSGRPRHEVAHPELLPMLLQLVDPVTRGDPESPLRWTAKSLATLSTALFHAAGIRVSDHTVARLLREQGYSLQKTKKTIEGKQHPDRNAQFEHINARVTSCLKHGLPFISVDTQKKELVGNTTNAGLEWQPKGTPDLVTVHDFPDRAIGKAIPYGIYDVAANSGFVNVGLDHDTPVFAVKSIETWWKRMGKKRYPDAKELFITADAGGSNGYRLRVWKRELQRFADEQRITVHVSHFSPGTSKWSKVEHRLFSFITLNWRGRPLRSYETFANLISNTTNAAGLVVAAKLDKRKYPTGIQVNNREMKKLRIERDDFHGDWNYSIIPREP